MYPILLFLLIVMGSFPARSEEADSLAVFRSAVGQLPKDGDAWVKLGYAYLNAEDFDNAKTAFQRGIKGDSTATAYNGLGLLYSQDPKAIKQKGFEYFQRALAIDPKYMEARINIARLHLKLGNPDAERALKNVIEADSTYAPAYLMLADWYKDTFYYDKRVALYKQYLSLKPRDTEGLYGFAMTYLEQHRYTSVLEVLQPAFETPPVSPQLLPLAAQAYAAKGDPDRAIELFQEYFASLREEERVLYEDLTLVSFPEEHKTYNAAPAEEREAFLDKFWQKRDVMLVSGGKARRAEHYRRVWYTRTFFGKKVFPWDRRGEVYIRYGEPDYRTRSDRVNGLPSLAVERIRDLNSQKIFGIAKSDSDLENRAESMPISEEWVAKSKPTSEEWVYVNVAGGLQLKFVDEVGNQIYNFPSMPKAEFETDISIYSQEMAFDPGVVYERVIRSIPEYHNVPPGVESLDFYYDFASFRGSARKMEKLELYFGVPIDQIASEASAGQKLSKTKMAVALLDVHGKETYRNSVDLVFSAVDTQGVKKGTFVSDVVPIEVPPGDYRLAVQLTDWVSGKWGVYMQDLSIPDYADSLVISDLELAWHISKARQQEKFRKGDVWVIPMPSRNYQHEQSPSVYYEVYNLTKDTFGQTRYRVDYTIQQDIRKGVGVFGALSAGMQKLMASGKSQVVVSYERTGSEVWEPIYLELNTKQVKAGLNQLEVTVTDLVSGQSVSKRAMFQLSGRDR